MEGKVVLFLMSQKGFAVLQTVLSNYGKHVVKLVVGSTDANVYQDYYTEIKDLCLKSKVDFVDRLTFTETMLDDTSDYLKIAISWRWLIKNQKNLVVVHDSLLPKYRGFAPLVASLIEGENEIGVSAIKAADDYDVGDIIAKSKQPIKYPIKIAEAIQKITSDYEDVVIKVLKSFFESGRVIGIRQDDRIASYSLWRDEEDYQIDWELNASKLERFINAVGFPYKGAYTTMNDQPVRIVEAREVADVTIINRVPGKVIFVKDGLPSVVCGTGILEITDGYIERSRERIVPLKKFRTRFK